MEPGSAPQDTNPTDRRTKRRFDQYFAVFEVEGRVYRELRHGFEKWSDSAFPAMFNIPEGRSTGSDESPIRLLGCTIAEFESLLEAIYPTEEQTPTLNKDEWLGVLKLSRLWNMPQLTAMAVDKISPELSPTEKLTMGKATAYHVPRWVREGYMSVIGDSNKITLEGLAADFGWETTARVLWGLKKASFASQPSLANLSATDIVDQIVEEEFGAEEAQVEAVLAREVIPSSLRIMVTQEQPVPRRAGAASIVSFSPDGVYVSQEFWKPSLRVIDEYGYDWPWGVKEHLRLVGDTTGSGRSDIIAFGGAGVYVSRHQADGTFTPAKLVLNDFGYPGGWGVERHLRYAVDLRNKGLVDLIAFGNDGVYVALNDGKGGFSAPKLVLSEFGYNHGWRMGSHLRFLADLTGNGLPDIIGFGEVSLFVALNNGDGTFQNRKNILNNFIVSGGWAIEKHPRILADLTGDGLPDIVGFFNDGVHVSFNAGNGVFLAPKLVLKDLGYSQGGWRVETHPRFVADVTGDGRGDLIGFAGSRVVAALNNGDGTFRPIQPLVQYFGQLHGYRVGKHLRLPVDLSGDGVADIIGFGEDAIWVSYNDGKGTFGPAQKLREYTQGNPESRSIDKTVRWVTNLYA